MGPETMLDLDPRLPQRAAPEPEPPLLLQMRRALLAVTALACAAAAVLLLATLPPAGNTWGAAGTFALLALAGAVAMRAPQRWLAPLLVAHAVLVVLSMAAATATLGRGISPMGLPLSALLTCAVGAAVGWRAGAVLAGVAGTAVLALLLRTTPGAPLVLQGGLQLIAIAVAMACGLMLSRVLARFMRSADERERRFVRLLALAADGYWEIDPQYRLVSAGEQSGQQRTLTPDRGLGRLPWDLPQFGCDAETLDALIADLDTRAPFRDIPVRWTGTDGRTRSYLASGEPRFDERGIFTGYWGVVRDVTAVHSVHEALAATETRYQELFTHIPTPLVLHRGGRVLDANPAALQLFGHGELAGMLASDLLAAFESGDSRERARRRMEALHGQPAGTALPVADFKLAVGSRVVQVRSTSVNVEADAGPAMLAIFVDDSERIAAEEAVRRSEALLSHLVATSPDLITLTEMATGRYAMVNHAFERLSGYSAAEAVGRTSVELGIWGHDAAARERFIALVRDKGVVSDMPVTFSSKSGKPVPLLLSAARFVMDRREYMVINARDISERERQRLEREAILNNASVGIAVTRRQHIVLANRHFERIYGYGNGELLGQPSAALWADPALDDELAALSRQPLADPEAGPLEVERSARRKDGSSFTALIRARAIDPARPYDGTIWIVEDVTERRAAEAALARARDDAEAASRAKSAFLANTSHELRTPLNGMIGLARLAQDPDTGEERRRQYLDQIATDAQSLAAIISDILDLSKIEAGKLTIETTTFDLAAELHGLQRAYTTLAAAHGLELRLALADDGLAAMRGDPLRVRQIVSNFVANAIKFTASGYVGITARRLSGERAAVVRIEVQDSGPGIDAATAARLFRPFTQADQSTTRRYGGTGLGLSICRELAALMGGQVGVDSRLGEGSTFWAELPLPAAPALAAGAAQAASPAEAPLPPGSLAGSHVLMVEDNPVNMMIAVAMLERWGVRVAQAQDGREAIAAVHRAGAAGDPFDAVLMDVQMPEMSGHEATRTLRAGGLQVPIIALTAAALVSEREAALAAGMNDFLTKPIDPHKLQASLLRWCKPATLTTD
jgi:PAS domain S-box-containing protein